MNKRISEMMDNLEPSLLEHIYIEDIRIEDMHIDEGEVNIRVNGKEQPKLKEEDISLVHIKRLALKNIVGEIEAGREGVEQEIINKTIELDKKRTKKRLSKKFIKRVMIPLVAATLLMGLTVVAISSSETLRDIFGDAFPMIQSEAQDIQKSMTIDGLTFTAEGAVIDDKAGLFIVSFVKEDGSPFEEGIVVSDIELDMENRGGMGWSKDTILTEDGTKLICMIDMSGDKKLYGQKLVLKAKSPGKWCSEEIESEVDLYEAYKQSEVNRLKQATINMREKNREEDEKWEYTGDKGLKIPFDDEKSKLTLDKVEWKHETLGIAVSYSNSRGEDELILDINLIDTRTGKEITSDGGSGIWDGSEGIGKEYRKFMGITPEDLPYLQMKISYEYFEAIADNEWEVEFELNQNQNIRTQKTNTRIETRTQEITIKEVEVSALGVKIEGIKHTRNNEYLEAYLQMKDGSKIDLWATGMSSSFNKIVGHYQVACEEDALEISGEEQVAGEELVAKELAKEDENSVEANESEGTQSSGYGVSTVSVATRKSSSDSEGMRIPKFIQVEEVESVVIEGKVIPIK